jgi:hypothetical protein
MKMTAAEYFDRFWAYILADTTIFIGGMVFGTIIATLYYIKHFQNIYVSPKFKKADFNIARIVDSCGNEYIYLNPKTIRQSLEAWTAYLWWNFRGKKTDYIIENKKLQRTLFIWVITIAIIVTLYGIFNIFEIQGVDIQGVSLL